MPSPPSSEAAPPAYDVSRSTALLARMRRSEALIDARPGLFFTGYERLGGQPLFVERAQGPYIWDIDGNRYIDYLLGFGSVVLGHAHPEVNAAVMETLARGVNPTLLSREQVELAEKLVALIPAADQVTFLKSGSDAIGAAVRLARAATGRQRVLQWGHHGWHDWSATSNEAVPEATRALTTALRYNDIDHARELFARHGGEIACVAMMPYEIDPPLPGYLLALQQLAHAHGALFVLDEIRSGFRVAMGGAQQLYGLTPDIAAFGKAIANGHAISVLAGRRAVTRHILKIGMTVTFYRSPDAMAAALATLAVLERDNGPVRLAMLGERLILGLNAALQATSIRGQAVGFPSTPFIRFGYTHANVNEKAMRLFCNGMLRRGVLLTPAHHWFVCTTMQEADIDFTVDAARATLADMEGRL